MCVVTEVPPKENEINGHLGNNLELYFGIAIIGYSWFFPTKTIIRFELEGLPSISHILQNPCLIS
jgi:hypothetical protein